MHIKGSLPDTAGDARSRDDVHQPPVLGNRDLLWRDKIWFLIQKELYQEFLGFLRSQWGVFRFGQLEKLFFYQWSKNPKALRHMQIQKDVYVFFIRKWFDPAAIAAQIDLFLREKDVASMEYHDYGNLTWSHPIMTLLPAASQKDEIGRGHDFFASRGIPPVGLALPFSPYNNATVSIVRKLGHACMLTVYEESDFLLPGMMNRSLILHRRMAPKDAGGKATIV